FFSLYITRRHPISTLFPYTTLFRSPGVTSGQYSRVRSKNDNGGNTGDWNREHTYAKSLGTPNLGEAGPGADAHHLRASDVQWNKDRKSTRLNSSHVKISYAVFCLKK